MEEQGDKKFNTGGDVKYYYVLALLLGYSSCVLAEECMDNSNIDSLREVFKKNNKMLLIEMSSKEMRRYVESDLLIKNKYSTHCQCI
ncbi:hypothetical protein PXW27_19895 [Klebsiella pneumoniae]|uniref:hypothetical protein n=1 Tax=Klebsiella pneumoniae TaxID=573 RepID=UPI002380DBCF|nr:hypothetical protein [Klebsiella pneumoniae]MDE4831125.1 hypothetical protein [Klebsiella pneumoniae]